MESRRVFVVVVAVAALMQTAWSQVPARRVTTSKASAPRPADGETGVTAPLLQWTPGTGAVAHDVYFGTDPQPGEAQFIGRQPVAMCFNISILKPETTYYWRVDEVEADGVTKQVGDVWRFTTGPEPWTLQPPVRVRELKASNPRPADGETGVTAPLLQWTPGVGAISHDVYFGTDPQPGEAQFVGRQSFAVYFHSPGVAPATTYYWRVDEVEADGVTKHVGDVWSFTTAAEFPRTHHVDGKRGRDGNDGRSPETAFATIQKGIDSAGDGDIVLVHPGVYRKPIDFLGKAITVRSAEQPAVLAVGTEFAVSFFTGEGPASVLENFVIRDSFLGVFIVQSSPTLRNLTVVGNKHGLESYAQGQPDVVNCIFWDNTADDLVGCGARYSCIERGAEGIGNFSSDPLFADPDDNDYHLRSERGRYWPEHEVWVLDEVTSPCIDAGDPQADYSKEPKPHGGRINLGAYGGTPWASLTANYAPIVVITAPADGATLYPSISRIEAQAWDVDGAVVKVEFLVNGRKIGEDTDGDDGWVMTWTNIPPDAVSGNVEIFVQAIDDDGAAGTDSVSITISQPRPPARR